MSIVADAKHAGFTPYRKVFVSKSERTIFVITDYYFSFVRNYTYLHCAIPNKVEYRLMRDVVTLLIALQAVLPD